MQIFRANGTQKQLQGSWAEAAQQAENFFALRHGSGAVAALKAPSLRGAVEQARMVQHPSHSRVAASEPGQQRGDRSASLPAPLVPAQPGSGEQQRGGRSGGGRGVSGQKAAKGGASALQQPPPPPPSSLPPPSPPPPAVPAMPAGFKSAAAPGASAGVDVEALLEAIDAIWPAHVNKETFMKGQIARHIVEQHSVSDGGQTFCTDLAKLGAWQRPLPPVSPASRCSLL